MTTFLVLPLHAPSVRGNPKGVLPQIRKQDADVAMLTEAYPRGLRAQLEAAHDYRYVMEDGGEDQVRGQYDVPILVRHNLRSLGSGQVFGCAAATPTRIAPERWMTYATQVMPELGPICAINLHPHAGVQDITHGRFNGTGRADKYRRQMRRLDALLTWAQANAWRLVVGGDLNFRDHGNAEFSPYRIFKHHGLVTETSGIIALASTPSLKLRVTEVKMPKGITDHVALKGVR